MTWKVGDPVVVLPDLNGMGGGRYVVSKVGRRWMTVRGKYHERRFSIADGLEAGDGVGGYCRAVTLERALEIEATRRAMARITGHGSSWQWALTAAEANAIADVLDAAKARRDAERGTR